MVRTVVVPAMTGRGGCLAPRCRGLSGVRKSRSHAGDCLYCCLPAAVFARTVAMDGRLGLPVASYVYRLGA
jgi:hypothetical protein